MIIQNGKDTPLNQNPGTLPDMGVALLGWFSLVTFVIVTTVVSAFQADETTETVQFQGVVQPFTARQLMLRPEGERAWTWLMVHAEPSLKLKTGDILYYNGLKCRVMEQFDYTAYGFMEYHLVQNWVGTP